MELSPAPDRCAQCDARLPQRASWCSLCLTPVARPAPVAAPAAPAAPVTPPEDSGTATPGAHDAAASARAEAMLMELSVSDRLGGLGDGVTGVVLRLGKLTRFALAFALAAAVALAAAAATALMGVLPGGG